jgi:hypothetical protein
MHWSKRPADSTGDASIGSKAQSVAFAERRHELRKPMHWLERPVVVQQQLQQQ